MEALYEFADLTFDPERGEITRDGRTAHLRPRTAAVLAYLLEHARHVVSKDDLLRDVWPDLVVTENSLSQCMREIRRELGDTEEALLRTVPRRGYLVDIEVTRRRPAPPPRTLLDKRLTIVVLPLVNVGGDPEQDYFAEGLTEDLTTDLGRMPSAFVISRGTAHAFRDRTHDTREIGRELGVRYAVEGSVRRSGEDVVVNLSLSDTQDATELWAERFEGKRAQLAALQRSMTGRVAQTLHVELIDAEARRTERDRSPNPDAHDLAMQAWSHWYRITREGNERAKILCRQAIERDARCTLAWLVQGQCHIVDLALRWTANASDSIDQAEAAVRRALDLEPNHPSANSAWGTVLIYRKRFEEALGAFATQMSLNPNFPLAHHWTGVAHILMGNPTLAIGPLENAVRLGPRDPRLSTYYRSMATAHLHAGDDSQALIFAERSVRLPNSWARSYETLAATYGAAHLVEDARAAVAELLRRWPGYSIATHRAEMISDRPAFLAQRERYLEGLRIAGLPET